MCFLHGGMIAEDLMNRQNRAFICWRSDCVNVSDYSRSVLRGHLRLSTSPEIDALQRIFVKFSVKIVAQCLLLLSSPALPTPDLS